MVDFEIKKTKNRGNGLFAKRNFDKGAVILHFQGVPVTRAELLADPDLWKKSERFLQIGQDLFLDIKDHSQFVNHHCNPNCYVKVTVSNAFLLASIPISAGDELTFDYSTTSSDPPSDWSMGCSCDAYGCRKVISGFQEIPEDQKQKMIEKGVVAKWLLPKK